MCLYSQKGQSLDKPPGVFNSPEELLTYEKMWHRDLYDCSMRGIKDRVCGNYTMIEYIIYVVFCTLCVYYTYVHTYVHMYTCCTVCMYSVYTFLSRIYCKEVNSECACLSQLKDKLDLHKNYLFTELK